MKKGVLLTGFVFIILSTAFVSAQEIDLRQGITQLMDWAKEFIAPIFATLLGVSETSSYFFEKILFLLLLYIVIYSVLRRVEIFRGANNKIAVIIALVVSLIGIRYISEIDFIQGLLLPYGALAISLAVILPFLIYFFFVHESIEATPGRRMAWILFAAVFFGLWISRLREMGQYNWIYGIGFLAIGLSIVFDREIHRYFGFSGFRRATRAISDAERVRLLHDYHRALNVYNSTGERAAEREARRLARQLRLNFGEGFEHGGGI